MTKLKLCVIPSSKTSHSFYTTLTSFFVTFLYFLLTQGSNMILQEFLCAHSLFYMAL
jgi:hypothetical protein